MSRSPVCPTAPPGAKRARNYFRSPCGRSDFSISAIGQTLAVDVDRDPYESASDAARFLSGHLGPHEVAIVLGSGWSDVADSLGAVDAEVAASQVPGTAVPGVPGHRGTVRSLRCERSDGTSVRVLLVAGRSHLYEGHDAASVVHTVRAAVMAGCSKVVLTNAAGSLRADVGPGSAVVISDQLNLTGTDPMCGVVPPDGPSSRFVDLTDLYSRRIRERLAAERPDLQDGVYAGLRGGSFETPAEIRMLRTLGADLVGMSTVLEAIAAHHLGAEVVGVSLVTNLAAGMQESVDHREVLAAGHAAADELTGVLGAVLAVL